MYSPMTKLVIAFVPFGRENAIKREELARKMCLSDRQMRQALAEARNEGVLICNRSDGCGYYQSAEIDELTRQYRQETNRALSILSRRKTIRRILKEAGVDVRH